MQNNRVSESCKEDINQYLKYSFLSQNINWVLNWMLINWIQINLFLSKNFLKSYASYQQISII